MAWGKTSKDRSIKSWKFSGKLFIIFAATQLYLMRKDEKRQKRQNVKEDCSFCSFFKWAIPGLVFVYFWSFQNNINTILQSIDLKKCPSSIGRWDSNPQPSECESPLITTNTRAPAWEDYLFVCPLNICCVIYWDHLKSTDSYPNQQHAAGRCFGAMIIVQNILLQTTLRWYDSPKYITPNNLVTLVHTWC